MISNIQITPLKEAKGKTKAFGKFTVNEVIDINFSVVEGSNGLFASLPRHKGKDKDGNEKWYNDVWVGDEKLRKDLQTQVVEAYNTKVGGATQSDSSGPSDQTPASDW